MKILVLGAHGMAGHMITKWLKFRNYHVTTVARSSKSGQADIYCDIYQDHKKRQDLLDNLKNYDYVINAQGILVGQANKEPNLAIYVNSWWPWEIAATLMNTKTRLVHISTDCVFNGKIGWYKESSMPDEANTYGRSKALGEIVNSKDITFRTSIIGPEIKSTGTGLFNWVTTVKNKSIKGFKNHYWNGITTLTLAKAIETYINNPVHNGIYHLTNNTWIYSKAEICGLINSIYNCGLDITEIDHDKAQNKALLNSDLNPQYVIPHLSVQLKEIKAFT